MDRIVFIFIGTIVSILVIIGLMIGIPNYNVWQKEMSGKAQLAEAEWNKRIMLIEAEMNLEAEKLNALAEIERAKGMAEAIIIEGGNLTSEYIQYLWVRQNTFNDKTVIYIPTEANIPILEANRRR
ncbi:MAG: hypothetical protein FWD47_04205 [Treponema sp.]|nr:hypothetical protein [Treponema sp.]